MKRMILGLLIVILSFRVFGCSINKIETFKDDYNDLKKRTEQSDEEFINNLRGN